MRSRRASRAGSLIVVVCVANGLVARHVVILTQGKIHPNYVSAAVVMKKLLKWAITFILFVTSNIAFSQDTIVLSTGEWAPFISKNMMHYGVTLHVITEAFALEGVKVRYEFFPWKRAEVIAGKGFYDGIAVASSKTEYRLEKFYFSDEVAYDKFVFFHLKGFHFEWETVNDLRGIKIGGTIGSDYGPITEAATEKSIVIEFAPTDEQNFKKIDGKRAQIFPMGIESGYYLLNKLFEGNMDKYSHHPRPIMGGDDDNNKFFLLLSKKVERNQRMIEIFNRGLKKLKDSGKYDQYYEDSRRGEYLVK